MLFQRIIDNLHRVRLYLLQLLWQKPVYIILDLPIINLVLKDPEQDPDYALLELLLHYSFLLKTFQEFTNLNKLLLPLLVPDFKHLVLLDQLLLLLIPVCQQLRHIVLLILLVLDVQKLLDLDSGEALILEQDPAELIDG